MQISIVENPEGYSDGTFGYVLKDTDADGIESVWFDGGFASQDLAREAAELRASRIEES